MCWFVSGGGAREAKTNMDAVSGRMCQDKEKQKQLFHGVVRMLCKEGVYSEGGTVLANVYELAKQQQCVTVCAETKGCDAVLWRPQIPTECVLKVPSPV